MTDKVKNRERPVDGAMFKGIPGTCSGTVAWASGSIGAMQGVSDSTLLVWSLTTKDA